MNDPFYPFDPIRPAHPADEPPLVLPADDVPTLEPAEDVPTLEPPGDDEFVPYVEPVSVHPWWWLTTPLAWLAILATVGFMLFGEHLFGPRQRAIAAEADEGTPSVVAELQGRYITAAGELLGQANQPQMLAQAKVLATMGSAGQRLRFTVVVGEL